MDEVEVRLISGVVFRCAPAEVITCKDLRCLLAGKTEQSDDVSYKFMYKVSEHATGANAIDANKLIVYPFFVGTAVAES